MNKNEIKILDVKIHALQPEGAVQIILQWMKEERKFHYITSTNINNIIVAQEQEKYFEVMNNADLSLPDGMPILWYGRYLGFSLPKRCGIEEVMEAVFDLSNKGFSYSHFFYGNTGKVLKGLREKLLNKYPKLKIVGMYSPPFRLLSEKEDEEIINIINNAKPDFLWVSLGCPKQEVWLYEHKNKLDVVVGGGAGAVFNFMAGHSVTAPSWVRYIGLEWFLRLLSEPKRLWKRYLIKYPKIFFMVLKRYIKGGNNELEK